jgi:fatty acid desaturase
MTAMNPGKPLSEIQREIRDFLGPARLDALHRQNGALDLLAVVAPVAAFVAILTHVSDPRLGAAPRAALVLAQGWLITILGLVGHDLLVHRRRYGGRFGWLLSALLFGVLSQRATAYGIVHLRHHGKVGTPEDPEVYKQDINSLSRRWLFATLLGFKIATSGRWSGGARGGYFAVDPPSAPLRSRLRAEVAVVGAIVAAFAGYAYVDPKGVLLGYLVPLLFVAPALNSMRIIIEHADVDPENPYAIATNYRTGPLSKALFLADSGDCHLVHHVFPRIPFYRMSAAIQALAPFFEAKGVPPRVSYLRLLRGWFMKNYAHRTLWPN